MAHSLGVTAREREEGGSDRARWDGRKREESTEREKKKKKRRRRKRRRERAPKPGRGGGGGGGGEGNEIFWNSVGKSVNEPIR